MDAICTFNYARWVPPKAGECGRWEYFVKEVNGKIGWVVDEEMREKLREEPRRTERRTTAQGRWPD